MSIVIISYTGGNTQSVLFALARLGVEAVVTADIAEIRAADRLIFPGVGAARPAMDYLREHQLDQVIRELQQPVLGICLGMQLLCRYSEEGGVQGLGLFDMPVLPFRHEGKIPHMGWNRIGSLSGKLFAGVPEGSYAYFVHSYYVPPCPAAIATAGYYTDFSAALQRDNFYAVQFHPEKSGAAGEQVLKNFLTI